MTNNDILRSLRYAINTNNPEMIHIFKLAGYNNIDETSLEAIMRKDGEEGYIACTGKQLFSFLDGLILFKRGPRSNAESPASKQPQGMVDNNDVLKKLRVAFNLTTDDILAILKLSNFSISPSGLGAFFRKKDHRNYMVCGDQFLRNFLRSLPLYLDKRKFS